MKIHCLTHKDSIDIRKISSMRIPRLFTILLQILFILVATSVIAVAADPGSEIGRTMDNSRRSAPANQGTGSVLLFNFYTSSPSDAGKSDTEFTITNTNASQSTAVHAFFIQGSSGSAADVYFCLAPNQTLNILGSDLDPGTTGYALMVASDQVTGCPISFNFLIGSDFVKLGSGHAAGLSAESYRALFNGPLPECAGNASMATLNFDGVRY